MRINSPHFRKLVSPYGNRSINTPVVYGMGESAEESIARIEREMTVSQTQSDVQQSTALTPAQLKVIATQEQAAMRQMEKDMKAAMINSIATQLAFEVAINAIPGVGAVLSVVIGQVTKKSGEHYKKKSEAYVKKTQGEIDTYRKSRQKLVTDTLGRVYDEEYPQAEAAAIALITEKVQAVHVEGLDGFGSFIRKAVGSLVKTIKDPTRLITKPIEQIKGFVDEISGKASYDNTVKAANDAKAKANSEIKITTAAQIVEAQSTHGRALMRTNIVSTLVQSPQFKRLAQLMLNTRIQQSKAGKNKALGKKIMIGAGVAVAAVVAAKML